MKKLMLLLFIACFANVHAEDLYDEFYYHGTVEVDGFKYYVNLSEDVGSAMLIGSAPAKAKTRSIFQIINGMIRFTGNLVVPVEGPGQLVLEGGNFIQARAQTRGASVTIDPDKEYTCELKIIGEGAFINNEGITSIEIPNTVVSIWYGAFRKCSNLEIVDIPGSVKYIGTNAFNDCTKLTTVTMGEGIKHLHAGAFSSCSKLSSINLPSTIETIGDDAFYQTTNLKKTLTLPASLTELGNRVFMSSGITEIDFGNGAVIETIGKYAFDGAQSLKKVTLPNSVKVIDGSAFTDCSSLEQIVFSENLLEIREGAFSWCSNLSQLDLPSSLNSIGNGAFSFCNALATIYSPFNTPFAIPNGVFSSEVYHNATLVVPYGTRDLYKSTEGWNKFLIIDDGTVDTECIEFEDEAVKALCVANWDKNNDGELSSREAEVVVSLNRVFLSNKDITSFNELRYFTGLEDIDGFEFSGCSNLSSIIIPKNVVTIGGYAFDGTNLEVLDVTEENAYFCSVDGIVYNKAKTTLIVCPPKKSGTIVIPENITRIDSYAFTGCKSITSVSLPSTLQQIGFGAFQLCTLGKISLPANVKTLTGGAFVNTYITEIDVDESNPYFKSVDGVLYSKDELTLVAFPFQKTEDYEIPEGTTTIGEYAFYNTKITKLTLPSTITSLERFAIAQSDNIRAVYSKVTTPQYTSVSEYAFNGSPFWLFVPDGMKSLYQNADGWNKRINIREMSEEVPGAIFFDDAKVEALCIAKWDRNFDGVLTESEAAMVTSIYDVFIGNTEIRSFNELKYFTSLQYIHENHFKGCSNLSSVTLPSSITKLYEKAFYGCNFKTFVIPKQIEYVGGGLCAGNPNLEEFIVDSENPTYWTEDGILCQYTTSNGINTPTIVSYPSKRNNKYTIPEGYKLLSYAFFSSDIEEVTISDHVGFSGGQCFGECNKLKVINNFMNSSISIINSNTFPESVYENATLFVAPGNKEWIEETTGWKNFKHIVEMIDEHDIAITANSYTIEYGEPIPTLEFSCEGGIITGTPTIVIEGMSQPDAGIYPIVISKGTVENPNTTYVNGTLTISKAPLTIKVGAYTRKQGEENPEFTLEYDGFKNDETEAVLTKKPTVTTTAEKESAVGDYEVTVSGAEALNYSISYIDGTLNVTEVDAVIVTAKSYTRAYGDANPTFEFTSSGAELNGIPEISCTATENSPAGTYDIVIKKGSVTNYNDSYVNGTLTITKAPLTIKAENYTKKRGEENPEFTLTYEGFKNDETEAVLLIQPSVTTDATKDSPIGSYVVTVSGAEAQNYEITHVNGTLVIERLISDANNDGKVDEEDLNAIVTHIMGDTPENFDKEAADMNGDGKVDAVDIVLFVNKIK